MFIIALPSESLLYSVQLCSPHFLCAVIGKHMTRALHFYMVEAQQLHYLHNCFFQSVKRWKDNNVHLYSLF